MKEDRERWNSRFKQRPLERPKPPCFIVESLSQLNPGSVLDLASGDGAATLYLAEQGYEVTAADISDVALARLSTFAHELDLSITTHTIDLDQSESLRLLGSFDNLVIAHFKPNKNYWPILCSLLRPGGKLLLTTFNLKHHLENGFSRRFCLNENELVSISEQLSLTHHTSVERNGNYMDDYLFVRK